MHLQRRLLERELQIWHAAGQRALLWWRDGDARTETPELRRLLALAERRQLTLTLAVTPCGDLSSLAACLAATPVTVAQQGLDPGHRPSQQKGAFRTDWNDRRTRLRMRADRDRLAQVPRALSVFVAPSNDIHADLPAALEDCGYIGWSAWSDIGPRGELPRVDAHLDLARADNDSRFRGEARFLRDLRFALEARRVRAEWNAPIGLYTRHLTQDEAGWAFLDTFLGWALAEPAMELRGLETLLEPKILQAA